jgi:hypothetical protein
VTSNGDHLRQQQNKYALCGRFIREEQEQEQEKSSILTEVIEGISYTFDKNECRLMFRRLQSVYGSDFNNTLAPQDTLKMRYRISMPEA